MQRHITQKCTHREELGTLETKMKVLTEDHKDLVGDHEALQSSVAKLATKVGRECRPKAGEEKDDDPPRESRRTQRKRDRAAAAKKEDE